MDTEIGDPLSTARRVEREIRRRIVTLEIAPGASLSEKDIADQMRVSRQPVREAFIALARAGLVAILPRRGTFVVKISAARMEEARFIREAMEAATARRACLAFDAQVRAQIERVLARQAAAAERFDHYAFQREDEAFHRLLAEGAGLPAAWTVIEDLKAHMDRVCHLTLPHTTPLPLLVAHHCAIMAAVDARDADAAERAMRVHLAEILRALPTVAERYRDLFE